MESKTQTKTEFTLTKADLERYSRHILIPEFNIEGQKKLKESGVLVIGAGGLGSPTLLYLAAAGVGKIGIIDFDIVDKSNLQRQIVHNENSINQLKVESAKRQIMSLNSSINIETYNLKIDKINGLEIFKNYDLIIDGTDNFETRYLVNDLCCYLKKPYVWGSIFRFEGQVSFFFEGGNNPFNYRDLYPSPPPKEFSQSCEEAGVLGILCGTIGSIMATEAIKFLTNLGCPLIGKVLSYNALNMQFNTFKIHRKNKSYDWLAQSNEQLVNENKTKNNINILSPFELKEILEQNHDIQLIDVRSKEETSICSIENALSIPLSDLDNNEKLLQLNKGTKTIIYCKSGIRSMKAVDMLDSLGFQNTFSLKGGILNWINEIDNNQATY